VARCDGYEEAKTYRGLTGTSNLSPIYRVPLLGFRMPAFKLNMMLTKSE